jgi:hypothetical protein
MIVLTCAAAAGQQPAVCADKFLLAAVRTIDRACVEAGCDFSKLRAIETLPRADLLTALRDPYLTPVHIFFPSDERELSNAFDWTTGKKDQLDTLRAASGNGGVVFILGKASVTGEVGTVGDQHNRLLSIDRMKSVKKYLETSLHIECHFKGGYFGREVFQLDPSDARLLNVEPNDFRNDPLILNQSVMIFVYPCPNLL